MTEGGRCGQVNPCACGLSCLSGSCWRPCLRTGTQEGCAPSQLCQDKAGLGKVCVGMRSLDESCGDAPCAPGLECQVTTRNGAGQPVTAMNTCHEPCAYGAVDAGCPRWWDCFPDQNNYHLVQEDVTGRDVTCNPAVDGGCDRAAGYQCNVFAGGTAYCSRPYAACGTDAPVVDLRAPPDGGSLSFSYDEMCNAGPALFDSSDGILVVSGGRFCPDWDDAYAHPHCAYLFQPSLPAPVGLCLAICHYPANGAQPAYDFACPPGWGCDFTTDIYHVYVQPYVMCTDDTGCAAYPGAVCTQVTGGSVCGHPYGLCQPE